MKKRLLSLVLVMVLLFSMTACESKADTAVPSQNESAGETASPKKTTLTVAVPSDAGTFYPYYQLSGTGRMLYTPVYETLFFYDESTEPVPILADSWTVDSDNMGITIKLKEGIKFSDGTEMTADDVLFSLDCIINSSYKNNIGDINREECKAIDDYTVYLRYNSVPGPLLYMLCNLYILSEDYMMSIPEEDWTYNCIGTGAFTWGEYTQGTEYHLVPNEYYREEKALDDITIKVIAESSVQSVQLETGEIDLAMGLSYKDIAVYSEDEEDGYSITKGPDIGSYSMWVNVSQAPYNDVRVRQAFAYAMDLDMINSIAFGGMATSATNIFSCGTPAWRPANTLHTHDVEKAKQLLSEAGYPDGVTLDLYCINTSVGQEIAEVMINSCAEAGITLNVTFSDMPTVIGTVRTGAPGYFLHLMYCNGDPYILLGTFASALTSDILGQGAELPYQEAREIHAKAMATLDNDARYVLYQELMDISYENCYTTPIMDVCDIGVHPDNLKGFWMGGPSYHYEDCYWE